LIAVIKRHQAPLLILLIVEFILIPTRSVLKQAPKIMKR